MYILIVIIAITGVVISFFIGGIITALVTALSFKQLGICSRICFWFCWIFLCFLVYSIDLLIPSYALDYLLIASIYSIISPTFLILHIPIYDKLANTKISKYVAFGIANAIVSAFVYALFLVFPSAKYGNKYLHIVSAELSSLYDTIIPHFIMGILMCMIMNLWFKSFNFYSKKTLKDSYFKPFIKWPILISLIGLIPLAMVIDVEFLERGVFLFGIIILLTILNFKIDSTLPTMQSNKT